MNNELVNYNPGTASLMEMRADPNRFPRLKSMTREQAVMGMAKIVSQAFLYRGQAADPTNIQFISSTLVQELLDDDTYGACYLSLAEIQVIVKRAVLGGTEMFGISDRDILVSKFASSAAHVKGTRLVSAETCTWIAEHFQERPVEIKKFIDRLFLSGVSSMYSPTLSPSGSFSIWSGSCSWPSSHRRRRQVSIPQDAAIRA